MEEKPILKPVWTLSPHNQHSQTKIVRKRLGLDKIRLKHRNSITTGLALGSDDLEAIGLNVLQGKTPQPQKSLTKVDFSKPKTRKLQTAFSKRSKLALNDSQDHSFSSKVTLSPTYAQTDNSFDLPTRDTRTFLTSNSRCNLVIPKLTKLNESTDSVEKINQLIKDCDQFSRKKQLLSRKVTRFQRNSKAKLSQLKLQDQELIFKKGYIKASIKKFKTEKAAFIFGKEGKGRFFDPDLRDPLKLKLYISKTID
mmetsp:Transcript_34105/g.59482  ORF Transcript_34105/g.59482 Transcript_34105/m.59482 type:complete len:253 (+) Transcript_34105:1743-2501(+)